MQLLLFKSTIYKCFFLFEKTDFPWKGEANTARSNMSFTCCKRTKFRLRIRENVLKKISYIINTDSVMVIILERNEVCENFLKDDL